MFPDNDLSDTAYVSGFNFPVKQLTFEDMKKDWEMGGIALNDPSAGLEYQLWEFTLEVDESTGDSDVYVQAPSVAKTLLFSGSFITEIAGCFDQNMNPMVAYQEGGDPKIWWWDSTANAMVHTTLPGGCIDLRCTLDDKRQFNVADSDIVLSYVRGGALYYRYQRERYLTEHLLFNAGSIERLVSLAMNEQWRLQWRLRGQSSATNALSVSEPYLGDIVYDLCRQSGILPQNINVSDLYRTSDIVPGMKVAVNDGLDKPIDWLREIYQFDKSQYNRKLNFAHRGREITFRIPYADLVTTGNKQALAQTKVNDKELPRKVNVNHIDSTGGFARNKQTATRRSNLITTDEETTIESQVVLTPDQAATAALTIIKSKYGEQWDYKFSTTIKYSEVTPGDVGEVQDAKGTWYRIRIEEKNEDSGVIDWEAKQDAGTLTYGAFGAPGQSLDPPVSTTPGLVGDTQLEILNLPVQRDQDDELGLYIAARGASSGWNGYALYYSLDGAAYTEAYTAQVPANIGETATSITDIGTTVEVLVPYPLQSVTSGQIAAGYNRAVIGDEEIQFQTATLLGMVDGQYHYNLTGIVRGVLRTTQEAWAAGIRFVFIDEAVLFIQIQREFYGQDIYYKAVSLGQSLDDVDPIVYLFDPAWSQTEWAGTDVEVVAAPGGGVTVTWDGAERLGTFGPSPYNSKYLVGYQVKFSDGHIMEVTGETATYASGLMGTVVEVRARNAITGLGPLFDGEGEVDPGETPTYGFSGSFPDMYELEPVFIRNGDNGISLAGGYWEAYARGFVVPGVGAKCVSTELSAAIFIGIPFAAGTYTSLVHVSASSPAGGGSGSADINQSITVLPRPTHGLLDLRKRDMFPWSTLIDTNPPWKKFTITHGAMYFYGVTSGKVVGQVIISGAEPLSVLLGINSDKGELTYVESPLGINPFAPSAKPVGDGTYSIELDADTGDFWIYEDGGGLIHSGNQPLPSGNQHRIGIATTMAQSFTAEFNGGNEAWFMSVTQAGHGGIPTPTPAVPLAWAYVDPDYALSFNGSMFTGAIYADDFAGGPSYLCKSNALYTTGRWRWQVGGAWYGMCVDTFTSADGFLGTAGTPHSVGLYQYELKWSWGGGGSIILTPLTGNYLSPIWALDADADTLAIYYQDHFGTPQLVHTLPLPAGQSWRVAACAGPHAAIVAELPGPAGYSDAVVP